MSDATTTEERMIAVLDPTMACTFCGKPRKMIRFLVINKVPPGTHHASICDECLTVAVELRDGRRK